MRAQVPRRRAVSARLAAGEPGDGVVGADEIGLLLRAALLRRRDMRPAVVRHFVGVPHHRLAGAGMALDGEARNEPGRANAERLQQRQDAPRAEQTELPARERRRARHAAGNEPRLRVEIEGQADDVAGHLALPERGHGRDRHSIVARRSPLTFRSPAGRARWRPRRSGSLSTARPAASARRSIWPMPCCRSSRKGV